MAEPEGLGAALMQLAALTEKLASLDHREAANVQEVRERIADLTTIARGLKGTQADQGEILRTLEGLDEVVAGLADRLDEIAPEDGEPKFYMPVPAPRWWRLEGTEREAALVRLRAWVRQVYRPGYGFLSAQLDDCWESHTICLYTLDWLSELWSVLYLQSKRTTGVLSGQAEWQTRLVAAAAEQMARETARCEHAASRNGARTAVRL